MLTVELTYWQPKKAALGINTHTHSSTLPSQHTLWAGTWSGGGREAACPGMRLKRQSDPGMQDGCAAQPASHTPVKLKTVYEPVCQTRCTVGNNSSAEMRTSAASPSAITDRAFEKSISKKHISHIGQIPKWLLVDNFFFFFCWKCSCKFCTFEMAPKRHLEFDVQPQCNMCTLQIFFGGVEVLRYRLVII